ncbi:hypothetical protein HAX54_045305 [Datura stramonium]|uniref:Uncharacterized protein n=1 Tax=Datura stramonium TaxID=4076 RepID=A0ABS8RPW7_DATST|nr:hypothetical protein [Datura stramonium]
MAASTLTFSGFSTVQTFPRIAAVENTKRVNFSIRSQVRRILREMKAVDKGEYGGEENREEIMVVENDSRELLGIWRQWKWKVMGGSGSQNQLLSRENGHSSLCLM